ncbi:MAG: glycoside hydrolase family 32 protein [Leucobacter sp.]
MNSLHFSPPRNWMNDPNGLIFHKNRYHLYFQHNPLGIDHGNLSWGHASSTDLVHWEHHPLAISFDDAEEIFSGSIVLDAENSTGFGTAADPALIACYTSESRSRDHQAQSIAFSLDDGMTWTKYAGNPVLDRGSAHFRDPKIIRWEGAEESYWVMVAVEAEHRQVVLYRSDDLLSWTYLSTFGPEAAVGGVWECPDLFPLRVEGTDDIRWVLLVSLNPGGIAGGSGTQYFIGEFDGRVFTPHERFSQTRPDDPAGMSALPWLDYGRDCYAGVSYAGLPEHRRILIAWMNDWDYARQLPVDPEHPVRGSMTLPRLLSLVAVDGRLRLRQTPIAPPVSEIGRLEDLAAAASEPLPIRVGQRIDLAVALEGAAGFAIRFEDEEGRALEISYDSAAEELSCDRRGGSAGFPAGFAGVQRMPVAATDELALTLWLDEASVEIYAEHGTRVLTALVGRLGAPRMRVTGVGGPVRIASLVSSEVAG